MVDKATAAHALNDTLNLARRYKLSAYDAACLELALRDGLPLAMLDAGLEKAVKKPELSASRRSEHGRPKLSFINWYFAAHGIARSSRWIDRGA